MGKRGSWHYIGSGQVNRSHIKMNGLSGDREPEKNLKIVPTFQVGLAVERICAAVEAARALPQPFVLTARAENHVRGCPDLDDTLWRLKAYEEAGADVLFAPGLPDEPALRLVCREVAKPVNYVAGIGPIRFSLDQLADFGVRRVSIGTSFVRFSLAATMRAANEVLHHGTFGYLDGVPTVAEFNQFIDPNRSPR